MESTDVQAGRDPEPGWVPMASCTLPTSEQPLRAAQFDDLFRRSLRGVQRDSSSPDRVRLLLGGDDGLAAQVEGLVAAETSCCSFFTFTLTRVPAAGRGASGTALALDVEVPSARRSVLEALVTRVVDLGLAP